MFYGYYVICLLYNIEHFFALFAYFPLAENRKLIINI